MQKQIRRYNEWDNEVTERLFYALQHDPDLLRHFNSRTRTAHKLWDIKCNSGLHMGTARKQAVAWLALRIRDELSEQERFSLLVKMAASSIAWLEIAEHFFFEFDPTENCWPRWSIDIDEAEENAALEPLKKERRDAKDGPLVEFGTCFFTGRVIETVSCVDIKTALERHAKGDWGDVCRETWEENEISLREGFRLRSVYHGMHGAEFWVITEADRSATTVLRPSEY